MLSIQYLHIQVVPPFALWSILSNTLKGTSEALRTIQAKIQEIPSSISFCFAFWWPHSLGIWWLVPKDKTHAVHPRPQSRSQVCCLEWLFSGHRLKWAYLAWNALAQVSEFLLFRQKCRQFTGMSSYGWWHSTSKVILLWALKPKKRI